MTKVVVSHNMAEEAMSFLEKEVDELVVTNGGSPEQLLPELYNADGVIVRIGSIDEDLMAKCPKLRVIGRTGVGYDDIDVKAAAARGIPVTITPGANSRAVAEHTFALILAAAKNIVMMDRATRKGNFNVRNERSCMELYGKKIFLVGFGNVGKIVSEYAVAFGMEVSVYDPFISSGSITGSGYEYITSLNEGLSQADIVSLHLPLTPETKGLFTEKLLEQIKPSAVIVNCARGGLIDEKALVKMLEKGRFYGAATDVFSKEPPSADDEIFLAKNLTISPHNASLTREAVLSVHKMCAESIIAVLDGKRWDLVADKSVYNHDRWRIEER